LRDRKPATRGRKRLLPCLLYFVTVFKRPPFFFFFLSFFSFFFFFFSMIPLFPPCITLQGTGFFWLDFFREGSDPWMFIPFALRLQCNFQAMIEDPFSPSKPPFAQTNPFPPSPSSFLLQSEAHRPVLCPEETQEAAPASGSPPHTLNGVFTLSFLPPLFFPRLPLLKED